MRMDNEAGLWGYFHDPNIKFPRKICWLADVVISELPHGLGYRFLGAPKKTVIQGSEIKSIIPFLIDHIDGEQEINDILRIIPKEISRIGLLKTLQILHANGLLVENHSEQFLYPKVNLNFKLRESLFWKRQISITGAIDSEEQFKMSLSDARIALVGTGMLGASVLNSLKIAGFSKLTIISWADDGLFSDDLNEIPDKSILQFPHDLYDKLKGICAVSGVKPNILILATRDAPRELIREVSRLCLLYDLPLLVCNETIPSIEIGPLIQPFSSACYHCMEIREQHSGKHTIEDHFYDQLIMSTIESRSIPRGESALVSGLVAHIIALEVIRFITNIALPTLVNRVLSISPIVGEIRANVLMRVPWCPECGGK